MGSRRRRSNYSAKKMTADFKITRNPDGKYTVTGPDGKVETFPTYAKRKQTKADGEPSKSGAEAIF
jgi:hypothetical protein